MLRRQKNGKARDLAFLDDFSSRVLYVPFGLSLRANRAIRLLQLRPSRRLPATNNRRSGLPSRAFRLRRKCRDAILSSAVRRERTRSSLPRSRSPGQCWQGRRREAERPLCALRARRHSRERLSPLRAGARVRAGPDESPFLKKFVRVSLPRGFAKRSANWVGSTSGFKSTERVTSACEARAARIRGTSA